MMKEAIRLDHISKRFQKAPVLKDIDARLERGEILGFLGPSGAGKTTTIKILTGQLRQTSGEAYILGINSKKIDETIYEQIGIVTDASGIYDYLTVWQNLEYFAQILKVRKERIDEVLKQVGLYEHRKKKAGKLSKGQTQRLVLARAVLHNPKVLFLDEPTIGLDAVSKLSLRQFLKEENQKNGITMILTTHDMDDVEALCSRVMTIGHGRLLYDGTLQELKETYAPLHRIRATLQENVQLPENFPKGILRWELEGKTYTAVFDSRSTPAHLLISALAKLLPLQDIVVEEQSVDEMVASMYRSLDLS